MISRRTFLKSSVLTTAGLMILQENSFTISDNKLNIGFISNLIGKELRKDWKNTLKTAVEYGFTEIEISKTLTDSFSGFLDYCKEIGIKPIASGIPFTDDLIDLKKKLDGLSALEIKYPVVYVPWKSNGPYMLEACKKSSEILNKMGEACKKWNMELCWHNMDNDLILMEDGTPFDYLMTHTDRDLVKCELDIYWLVKAGGDPLYFLKKYKGRYPILHLKDMTSDQNKTFECVGKGIIDFPSIIKEALKQDIKHFMVEYDQVADGMACLKTGGEYLRSLSI